MVEPQSLVFEKRRDYRNAVFIQVGILIAALTLEDLLTLFRVPGAPHLSWGFFLIAVAVYLWLLWDMLKNFTANVIVLRTTLALLIAIYATNLLVNQFGISLGLNRNIINIGLFLAVTALELVVIQFAVSDLFRSPRDTADKLWGSACIYFMSGLAFANIFHVLHLLLPNAFGSEVSLGFEGYFEALYISFNSLVGLDTSYPNSIRLVRNLAVLEGMWGQLYLVLLIGRVLMPTEGEGEPAVRQDAPQP